VRASRLAKRFYSACINIELLTSRCFNGETSRVSQSPMFRRAAIPVVGLFVFATGLGGLAGCEKSKPAAVAPAANFGGTDLAWIEITIAMDEQVQPLLALVPQKSKDARTQALARTVQAFTGTELTELRALHDEAGLPAQNPHEGMPMPGLVSADTVQKASALSGTAFDKLVREQIAAHLKQGQSLAESEEKAGTEQRTRALASDVIHTRTEALGSL
jgi:uncharacterized protein (DUF305 family)